MPQGDDAMGKETPESNSVVFSTAATFEFNRREASKQTRADALKQAASMEIWGKTPFGGNTPTVQAYRETQLPLANWGPRGVMFDSAVPPTPGTGSPFEARWRLGTLGVSARPGGFAAISVTRFVNLQP